MVINREPFKKLGCEHDKEIFVLFFAEKWRLDYGIHEFGKHFFFSWSVYFFEINCLVCLLNHKISSLSGFHDNFYCWEQC